jgi:hypothetical protein
MRDFELGQIKAVGATLVRVDYLNSSNAWYPAEVDAINRTIAHGLEPELVIGGSANPGFRTVTQYAADCTEAAKTWHGKVRYFEAMNEPNTASRGWTPAAYEPYLAACHDAIKAVDSRNVVLLGGINPSDSPVAWEQGVYAAGGKGKFDLMNWHLYGDPGTSASYSFWCKLYGCNGLVSPSGVSVMAQYGDSAKPIVSTEGGSPVSVGEQTQATVVAHNLADTRLAQSYIYNMLADPNLDYGMMVRDTAGAIVDPTGTHWRRRPSFAAMQSATGGTG